MVQLLVLALAVQARSPPTAPNPVAALEVCRTITDGSERLACFDRAAASVSEARKRRDIIVMDRGEVQRTKRGLFGFSLPSLRLFGDGDGAVREIRGTLRAAAPHGYGYYLVTLDDASVWLTTDRVNGFAPKAGDAVRITTGAFGYRLHWKFAQLSVKRER